MTRTRLPALAVALLAALATGCGAPPVAPLPPAASAAPAQAAPVPAAPATPDPSRAFSTADIEFLAAMLGHHAAAQQMTDLAEQRAAAPAVRAFAAASHGAEQREIDQMRAWLVGLGIDPAEVGGEHDHNGHVSAQDLTDLAALTGPAFDRRFVDLFGAHGIGAVALAKDEATGGFNLGVRQLAAEIAQREWSDLETVRRL